MSSRLRVIFVVTENERPFRAFLSERAADDFAQAQNNADRAYCDHNGTKRRYYAWVRLGVFRKADEA